MGKISLDTSGLRCPLPVLKAKKALSGMAPGDELEVISTDEGSPADFETLCAVGGHRLASQSADGGIFRFVIIRG